MGIFPRGEFILTVESPASLKVPMKFHKSMFRNLTFAEITAEIIIGCFAAGRVFHRQNFPLMNTGSKIEG